MACRVQTKVSVHFADIRQEPSFATIDFPAVGKKKKKKKKMLDCGLESLVSYSAAKLSSLVNSYKVFIKY